MKVLSLLANTNIKNRVQTFVNDIRLDFIGKSIVYGDLQTLPWGMLFAGSFLGPSGKSPIVNDVSFNPILQECKDGASVFPFLMDFSYPELEMNHLPDPASADGIRASMFFVFSNSLLGNEQTLFEFLNSRLTMQAKMLPSVHQNQRVLDVGADIALYSRTYLPETLTMRKWNLNNYNDTRYQGRLPPNALPENAPDYNTILIDGEPQSGWNWIFSEIQDHWFTGRIASIDAVDETITVTATNQLDSFVWPRIPDVSKYGFRIYPESRGERIPIIYGECKGYEVPIIHAPWSGKLATSINDDEDANIFFSPPFEGIVFGDLAFWIGGERITAYSIDYASGKVSVSARGPADGSAGSRTFHSAGEQIYQEGEIRIAAGDYETDQITALYVVANESEKPVRIAEEHYSSNKIAASASSIGIGMTQIYIGTNQFKDIVSDYQIAVMSRQPGLKNSETGSGLDTFDTGWRDIGGNIYNELQPLLGGWGMSRWDMYVRVDITVSSGQVGYYLYHYTKPWAQDGPDPIDWENSDSIEYSWRQNGVARWDNLVGYSVKKDSDDTIQRMGMRYPSTASGYDWSTLDGAGTTTSENPSSTGIHPTYFLGDYGGSLPGWHSHNGKQWGDSGSYTPPASGITWDNLQDDYIGSVSHSLTFECSFMSTNLWYMTFNVYCFGGQSVWWNYSPMKQVGSVTFVNPTAGVSPAVAGDIEPETINWRPDPLYGARFYNMTWYDNDEQVKGVDKDWETWESPNFAILPGKAVKYSEGDGSEPAWEINLVEDNTQERVRGAYFIEQEIEYQEESAPSLEGAEVSSYLGAITSPSYTQDWPWNIVPQYSFLGNRLDGIYAEWRNQFELIANSSGFTFNVLNEPGWTGPPEATGQAQKGCMARVVASSKGAFLRFPYPIAIGGEFRPSSSNATAGLDSTETPVAVSRIEMIVECTDPGEYIYDFTFSISPKSISNNPFTAALPSQTVHLFNRPRVPIDDYLDSPFVTYNYDSQESIDVFPGNVEIGIASPEEGEYHQDRIKYAVIMTQTLSSEMTTEYANIWAGVRSSYPALKIGAYSCTDRPSFTVKFKLYYRTEQSVTTDPPVGGGGQTGDIPVDGAIQAHPGALGLKFFADGIGPRAAKGTSTTDVVNDIQAYDDKNHGGDVAGGAVGSILQNPTDIIKRWIAKSPRSYDYFNGPAGDSSGVFKFQLFDVDYSNIQTSSNNLNAHYRRFIGGTNSAGTIQWSNDAYRFGFDARTLGSDWESVLSRLGYECRTNIIRTTGSGRIAENKFGMPFKLLAAGLDPTGTEDADASTEYQWPDVSQAITVDKILSFSITEKDASDIANKLTVNYDTNYASSYASDFEDVRNFQKVSVTDVFGNKFLDQDFGADSTNAQASALTLSNCTATDETTDTAGLGLPGDVTVVRIVQTGSDPSVAWEFLGINGSTSIDAITFKMRRTTTAVEDEPFSDFLGKLEFGSEDYPAFSGSPAILYSDYYGTDPSAGNIGSFYITFDLNNPPEVQTPTYDWSTFKTAIQDSTDIIDSLRFTIDGTATAFPSTWDIFSASIHSRAGIGILDSQEKYGVVPRNEYLLAQRSTDAVTDWRRYIEKEYARDARIVRAVLELRTGMTIELGDIVTIDIPKSSKDEATTPVASTITIRIIAWGRDDTGCQIVGVET